MDRTAKEDTGVKQQILRRIYLFSGIAEADLSTLARMAVKKTFPRQATIFSEGKEAQGFYLLITGQIKLVKSSLEGKEYIIRLVGPGESFAEAAVFGEIPYPATAITLEDCHTLFFPQGAVFAASGRLPGLGPQHAGHLEPLDVSPDQTTGGSLSERSISPAGPVYIGEMPAYARRNRGRTALRIAHHQNAAGRLPGYYQRNIVSNFIPI